MRSALLCLLLAASVDPLLGQTADATPPKTAKAERLASVFLPYRVQLVPGLISQAAEKPKAPATRVAQAWTLPLPYRNWQELLTPDRGKDTGRRIAHQPGQCAIPLIPVPLPRHFDDRIVQRQGPRVDSFAGDQPMSWTPMPVCALHGDWATTAHLP